MKPQPKKRRSTYHHGDLRTALISAARRILEKEGLAALTLRGAARKAGVSQAAPYHHFVDKDALLAAVAAQGFEELTKAMEDRIRSLSRPSARTRLHASGVGYVAFATTNPALFRLMFGAGTAHPNDERGEAKGAYAVLERAVDDALKAAGRPPEEAPLACLACWSVVHGLSKLVIEAQLDPADYGQPDIEALTAEMLRRELSL